MKYLITGKNGQLAQAFVRRLDRQNTEYAAPEEACLDITDRAIVADVVRSFQPDVIINCAAYNLVDKAEQDNDKAFAVNASGPGHLAQAASEHGAVMVHFGSDYVFDGSKETGLYTENDRVNPLNIYGKSKLAGEEAVLGSCERALVFRLSWVFGDGKQNFIHKLKSWAESSEYLKIACDEFSVPTWTETVVDCTFAALDRKLTGRYHLTNTGFCSRYEWAKFVLNVLAVNKFIRPVSMDTFNLPAIRPRFSAMSNATLSGLLNIRIPPWEEAVSAFVKGQTL
jgi:dTDP-4-dehydrorhamnose reductase